MEDAAAAGGGDAVGGSNFSPAFLRIFFAFSSLTSHYTSRKILEKKEKLEL
jgi:hypothetical protein